MENTIFISGYVGIEREAIYISPAEIIVRFYPFGNYDADVEFAKYYDNSAQAIKSFKAYLEGSLQASKEERAPENNDWMAFQNNVNLSMIKLYKNILLKNIPLPDSGLGFRLRNKTIEEIAYWIKRHEDGEILEFVRYRKDL